MKSKNVLLLLVRERSVASTIFCETEQRFLLLFLEKEEY
jgi:hypothetical protein